MYFPEGEHVVQVTKLFQADSERSSGWYVCLEGRVVASTREDIIGRTTSHVVNSKHGDDLIASISKSMCVALGADLDKLSDPATADEYLNSLTDVGKNGLSEEFMVDGEGLLVRVNCLKVDGKKYLKHVYSPAEAEDYELL